MKSKPKAKTKKVSKAKLKEITGGLVYPGGVGVYGPLIPKPVSLPPSPWSIQPVSQPRPSPRPSPSPSGGSGAQRKRSGRGNNI